MKALREIIPEDKNYQSDVHYVKSINKKDSPTVLANQQLFRSGAKFARKDVKAQIKHLKQWTKQGGLTDAQHSEVQKGFDNERRNNPNGFAGVRLGGKHRFHSDGEKFKEFKGLK
jgi:hypothetical protein